MKRIARYLNNLSDDFKRMHLVDIVNDYEMVIYDELNLIKRLQMPNKWQKLFKIRPYISLLSTALI